MVDDRGWILADVAVGYDVLRAARLPLADETMAEIAAVRTVLILAGEAGAGAGVEMQNMGHDESPD
ncbi:hypothetical protein N619_17000 [Ectopseudomonas oleovorans]|nr:hypothetical protein N619_17000 [Pseudomonas oleovorans]